MRGGIGAHRPANGRTEAWCRESKRRGGNTTGPLVAGGLRSSERPAGPRRQRSCHAVSSVEGRRQRPYLGLAARAPGTRAQGGASGR
eukprot:12752720-Alexandrium_andersonii.AAC.1